MAPPLTAIKPNWGFTIIALAMLLTLFVPILAIPLLISSLLSGLYLFKRKNLWALTMVSLALGSLLGYISNYDYLTKTLFYTGQLAEPTSFLLQAQEDAARQSDNSYRLTAQLLTSHSQFISSQSNGFVTVYLEDYLNRGEIFYTTGRLRLGNFGPYIVADKIEQQSFTGEPSARRAAAQASLITHFQARLGKAAGLVTAVVTGNRNYLSPLLVSSFRQSGTAHLMALSGYHLALLSGFLFLILRFLPKTAIIVVSLPIFITYLLLSGFQYSLARAVIMAIVAAIFFLAKHNFRPFDLLGLAFIVLCLADSAAFYTVSFRLSFLAMVGIFLLYRPINSLLSNLFNYKFKFVSASFALTMAAQSFTAPYALYVFGTFYPISIVATLTTALLLTALLLLSLILVILPAAWFLPQLTLAADWVYAAIYESTLWFGRFWYVDINFFPI
ncbi:MAG: ComEC/Rec2 family competence protein [Spirochaetaceae bacterium]|nr:ComEC/Rec2 family competence protein [Spirochaetaceae bacterium]